MSQIQLQIRNALLVLGFMTLISSVFLLGTPSHVFAAEVAIWTNMEPTSAPPPRIHAPMTYLEESDLILLFGGFNNNWNPFSDTWVYDYNTNIWTQRKPSSAPIARGGHAFSYDVLSDEAVLFGGWKSGEGDNILNRQDTWTYECATNKWTNRTPTTNPPPRCRSALAYIREADCHILFGGLGDGGVLLGDTWIWDRISNTWTNQSPLASPPARFDHRTVYDRISDKIILVGGTCIGGRVSSDVWAYDHVTNTWTERASCFSRISSQCMTYDSIWDRITVFGGSIDDQENRINNETWTYHYESDIWSRVSSTVWPPATTRTHMAYDAESNCSILFSGRGPQPNPTLFEDTWALNLSQAPITTPPPLFGFPTLAVLIGLTITIGLSIIYRRQRQ